MKPSNKFDPEVSAYEYAQVPVIVTTEADHLPHVSNYIKEIAGTVKDILPLVNGCAAVVSRQALNLLAENPHVVYIGMGHEVNVSIIKGIKTVIEKAQEYPVRLINLSLGLPTGAIPKPFDEREPVNVALKRAYEKGLVVCVAAGNEGEKGEGTLSPWAAAQWVIGVGAAHPDGPRLWGGSSIGSPGGFGPTVVAPGVDIVGPWPPNLPKTSQQLEKDKKYIPNDRLDRFTVMTGTSQATACVSHVILCYLIPFLGYLRDAFNKIEQQNFEDFIEGHPIIAAVLDTAYNPIDEVFNHRDVIIRFITKETQDKIDRVTKFLRSNKIRYFIEPHPDVIKKMLEDMARPMTDYQTYQVGRGFVDESIAMTYLKGFGLPQFLKFFVRPPQSNPDLGAFGENIGPLLTEKEVEGIGEPNPIDVKAWPIKVV